MREKSNTGEKSEISPSSASPALISRARVAHFDAHMIQIYIYFFELRVSLSNQWIMRNPLTYTKFMDFPLPFAFSHSEARHYGRY